MFQGKPQISVSADPVTGGTVTATASEGYTFESWTQNGTVVSTDATHIFTVSDIMTLVANFACAHKTYEDGICTRNGEVTPATCTEQAVCDRCGVGYGDVNPDNHIFGDDNCCTNEGCSAAEECTLTFIDGDTRTEVEAHYHDLFYFGVLPDKEGLTFLGWDEDDDGVADYAGSDTPYYTYIDGPKTYTAICGAMYLVSYYRIGYDSGEYEL